MTLNKADAPAIVVTLDKATNGYWDGGPKSKFEFTVNFISDECNGKPYIKWGSWEANMWFTCTQGRTWALSASYAVKRLRHLLKVPGTIETIWE